MTTDASIRGSRRPVVLLLEPAARSGQPPLTALLARARALLADVQATRFQAAGGLVRRIAVPHHGDDHGSFGALLRSLIEADREGGPGIVVLGAGAVPLLTIADARRLLDVAASGDPVALTNNRWSSDVCAVGRADVLRALPALPSDNGLPRWLSDHAGVAVAELPARERLALDLDTPLDLALLALVPRTPLVLRRMAAHAGIAVPRLSALRSVAADPTRELLVAGRSGSRTLAWLERHPACRVRFLAEERGLRAAAGPPGTRATRPPRSTLGRLLAVRGPAALGAIVAELADAAVLDSRVLLADRLGPDERGWPPPEDRFASDLLEVAHVRDPWLHALTAAARAAPIPILLGAHTLVGPGIRHVLAAPRGA